MNRARLPTFLTVALLIAAASPPAARADDMFPPTWRGDYGTLTAMWGYWGDDGWGPRTFAQTESQLYQANPGGFPPNEFPAIAYMDNGVLVHQSDFLGRDNVLEIFPESAGLFFGMSNYEGGTDKWIQLQITFWGPGPGWFRMGTWSTDPGDPPWELGELTSAVVQDSYPHEDGWQTNSYLFELSPNPRYEAFQVIWAGYGWVNQVVVDTLCFPEPSTIGMLALGSLIFMRHVVRGRRESSHK